jgi:hypothetical protein
MTLSPGLIMFWWETEERLNGPVYDGIQYRNFLFLNFIPALIYTISVYLFFSNFLTVYPCFAFQNYTGISIFPFRALLTGLAVRPGIITFWRIGR